MSGRKPWRRLPGESTQARRAFMAYLNQGPARSLRVLADQLGHPPSYRRTLERWSVRHDWQARVAAFDEEKLNESLTLRPQVREAALRLLQLEALDAAEVIAELARGELRDGDELTVRDRQGVIIGRKPAVTAQVRLMAAIRLHESLGIIPPKRIEHTGADGAPIETALRVARDMTDEELAAYLETAERLAELADQAGGDTGDNGSPDG